MILNNCHRNVISFMLRITVSITCVIFRLGCSLKTEFIRAILAALRRASAFVGQVWSVLLLLLLLLMASLVGIVIGIGKSGWYSDLCQSVQRGSDQCRWSDVKV